MLRFDGGPSCDIKPVDLCPGTPRNLELAHRVVSILDPGADFLVMLGLPRPDQPPSTCPMILCEMVLP